MKFIHYTKQGEPWYYDTQADGIEPGSPECGVKVPRSRKYIERDLANLRELALTFKTEFLGDDFKRIDFNFSEKGVSITITINTWHTTFYSHLCFNYDKCENDLDVKTRPDDVQYYTKSDLKDIKNIKKIAASRFVELAKVFRDRVKGIINMSPAVVDPRLVDLVNNSVQNGALAPKVWKKLDWRCYNSLQDSMAAGNVGFSAVFRRNPSKTFRVIEWKVLLNISLDGSCERLQVERFFEKDKRVRKFRETTRLSGDNKLLSLKKFIETDINKMIEQVQALRAHNSDCRCLTQFGFDKNDPCCSFKRGKSGPVVKMTTSSMHNYVELRVEKNDNVISCSVAGIDKKTSVSLVQAIRDAMKNAEIDDSIEEL